MAVRLVPMRETRMPEWIRWQAAEYARSREEAGEPAERARATAERSVETYFPEGRPLAGHLVFEVWADDEPVGVLWLGPHPQRIDGVSWWVFEIAIDEEHRRRGHGRSAMLLAEQEVAQRGGVSLGLNVFGFNTSARALYEELGYDVTSLQMQKPVRPA